jgi:4-amino-4-deoxy-L-arabinose transferase-like glycosyltransferase
MDTSRDILTGRIKDQRGEPSAVPEAPAEPGFRSGHGQIALILAIVAMYVLPGLIGHDPWKQDETYITEIVRHMRDSGDWTVPQMAGEPFMEKPPLFYWVAALCASLFAPLLPLHDSARLATGFFICGTCAALAWAGQRWWGRDKGWAGVVTLLSCLGMAAHAHFMLTDFAMLMGFALAICGLALCQDRVSAGGILFGTGVGIGFLGKGLLALGVLGASALLLPLLFHHWRRRSYFRSLAIAFVAAAPWLFIWPAALFHRSPQLFMDWLWLNNIGRFVGFAVPLLGASHDRWFWLSTLPWFTFPALPMALYCLWRHRKTALSREPFQISIVLSLVLWAVLWQAASARDNYALPLLLPMALLAAPVAAELPSFADRCWVWSSRAVLGAFAATVWGSWIWMMVRGAPPYLPIIARYLPNEFVPRFEAEDLIGALALTAAPLFCARSLFRFAGRGLGSWLTGLTICWALVATLWLPWLDFAKSYRSVFDSMKTALPSDYSCVAETGMGESERAMLSYFLGITAVQVESGASAACDVLIVNGPANAPRRETELADWLQIWQGARPGDKHERFWLYSRRPLPRAQSSDTDIAAFPANRTSMYRLRF